MPPEPVPLLVDRVIHAALPGSAYAVCGVPTVGGIRVANAVACPRCREAKRSGTVPKVVVPVPKKVVR